MAQKNNANLFTATASTDTTFKKNDITNKKFRKQYSRKNSMLKTMAWNPRMHIQNER